MSQDCNEWKLPYCERSQKSAVEVQRGMDEGSGEDLTLPRREFVILKSCLDVLLARILVL